MRGLWSVKVVQEDAAFLHYGRTLEFDNGVSALVSMRNLDPACNVFQFSCDLCTRMNSVLTVLTSV